MTPLLGKGGLCVLTFYHVTMDEERVGFSFFLSYSISFLLI